jgi:hypothetical protein
VYAKEFVIAIKDVKKRINIGIWISVALRLTMNYKTQNLAGQLLPEMVK